MISNSTGEKRLFAEKRGATLHKSLRFLMRQGYFSRLAQRHPFGRWFPLLLVALQVVAPLWHVCEMSGNCADCHGKKGALVCRGTKKSAAPRCKHCKVVAFIGADSRSERFKGTCLARELMSMARVTVAPLALKFQITRVRVHRPKHAPQREFFASSLPPSRGPPAPFVVL